MNDLRAVRKHLTPNLYVDTAFSNIVDESSLIRLDFDEYFKLIGQDFIIVNFSSTSPKAINKKPYQSLC